MKHLPGHAIIPANQPKKKVNILVGICSCNNAHHRRVACRETWLSHPQPDIECRFFLGRREPLPYEPDVVNLWVDDGYYHLPAKGLAFYKWALENYDFDWLFKCDDDTYLALDRLASLCDSRYDLIGDLSVEIRKAPSGGAGYLMSRRLVELFINNAHKVPPTGAEDLIFGTLAYELGAPMLASVHLGMYSSPAPHQGNELVSCHWCNPDRLRAIEQMYAQEPMAVLPAEHPHWKDDVLFYANGQFMRRSSGCSGWFSISPRRELTLHWDSWPEDKLLWDGSAFRNELLTISPVGGHLSLCFDTTA